MEKEKHSKKEDKKSDEQLKEKKKTKKKTEKEVIAELTESLQRLQAEFENYKKQIEKQSQEFVKYAKGDLINKILPTLDTFEIALKSTQDQEKFVKGMEMIYAQLFTTLENEGLRPIDSLGKKFDANLHEVMLKQKSDKEENTILEELQKGFMLNDKVLRHTKVKVSEKGKDKDSKTNDPKKQ